MTLGKHLDKMLQSVFHLYQVPYATNWDLIHGLAWHLHYQGRASEPKLTQQGEFWRAEITLDGRTGGAMDASRSKALAMALLIAAGEDPEEEGLTVIEAAEYIGRTGSWLDQLARDGQIPVCDAAGCRRFHVAELDAYLQARDGR